MKAPKKRITNEKRIEKKKSYEDFKECKELVRNTSLLEDKNHGWEDLNKRLTELKNMKIIKLPEFVSNSSERLTERSIKSALLAGDIPTARELRDKGLPLPPTLIFSAMRKNSPILIDNIITHSFYPSEIIELAFWNLLFTQFTQSAHDLYCKEPRLSTYCSDSDFSNQAAIEQIISNQSLLFQAFDQAITFGVDEAACWMLRKSFMLLNVEKVKKAKQTGCVRLLKIVWSGDLSGEIQESKQKLDSLIWDCLKIEEKNGLWVLLEELKPTNLLLHFLERKMMKQCQEIIRWTNVKNSMSSLKILINSEGCDQLVQEFVQRTDLKLQTDDLELALVQKKHVICEAILWILPEKLMIKSTDTQLGLIDLLNNGRTCLLSVEIISRISKKAWHTELTRNLCQKLKLVIKKKNELVYCQAPILFCVKAAELMKTMSSYSRKYQSKCLNIASHYLSLGASFQDSISNEDSLKFYLAQTDSKNRTVLEIVASNKFYELLSNHSVGLIITKLWLGSENHSGIHKVSSLFTSLVSPTGSDESAQFMIGVDKSKPYSFQFDKWIHACNNRFSAFGFSILALIVFYQVFLYVLVGNESVLHFGMNPHEGEMFKVILVWIFGVSCEQVLRIMYMVRTKGKILISGWQVNDWLIAGLALVIAVEVPYQMFLADAVTFQHANMGAGIIYSIMLFMLCMKYVHVLMTSQAFGPFLSMILIIVKEVVTFFVVYAGVWLCAGAIFTLLFKETTGFGRLDLSLRTLFMATAGPFNITSFSEDRAVLGPIILAAFILLAHTLMLSLLIGIVVHNFEFFQKHVESDYRAVLIGTYYNNVWNEDCGMLIFLPAPLNTVSLVLSPLVFSKNSKMWNRRITKALYLFYAIPYFCIFLAISFIALPFVYIQGFYVYGQTGREVPEKHSVHIFNIPTESDAVIVTKFSYMKSFSWIFIGIPWLLFAIMRDSWQFWVLAYYETPEIAELDDKSIVDQRFIRIFQKALERVTEETVTCEEFLKVFKECGFGNEFKDDLGSEDQVLRVIKQFALPVLDGIVEVRKIREMFPKRIGGVYEMKYVDAFVKGHLGWVYKGISSFTRKSMGKNRKKRVEGVFEEEIEKVENLVKDQKKKILGLTKEIKLIERNQKNK